MNKSPRQDSRRCSSKTGLAALGVLALTLFLTACKTGPDYERPSLDVPDAFKSAAESETGQPELGLDWWKLFWIPNSTPCARKRSRQTMGSRRPWRG